MQHARRRQNEEGSYPEVPPGINESPDRFIGKPTIQKTTASSFSRLGLCALTIWAAEYFARAGERSTIALKAELAQ